VDKAVSEEASYRRNMNQSSGYSQRNYWRKLVDEKLKEIEEKKKEIEELESSR
jgi:major membrane immunogen (membrane-anchored lipoprotein)